MINNDILRRFRYALDISDSTMVEIFKLSRHEIDRSDLAALLKTEDETGFVECSDTLMNLFLDGFIVHKRGRKETKPDQTENPVLPLTNNVILKKIRIALELKEEDMLGILNLANIDISKSELTALFRRPGHKHYKPCGDQFLRHFLKGLTALYRG